MSKEIVLEYTSTTTLEGDASVFIMVPQNILFSNEPNNHLISVFSYFSIKRGLDGTVNFSVNGIVSWLNKQPNRNKNGINAKVIECIEYLKSENYLMVSEPLDNASMNEAVFNAGKVRKECEGHTFIILYLDELKKILHYRKPEKEKSRIGYDTVLLVFLYLRYITFKRPNKLMIEEIGKGGGGWGDIEARRAYSPEAFDAYYYQLAENLALTDRAVSAAVKILSDLELVYFEQLPRYKYGDEWRTDHTIFAFYYKREKGKLLAAGKSYYELEVANKKKKLENYRKRKCA